MLWSTCESAGALFFWFQNLRHLTVNMPLYFAFLSSKGSYCSDTRENLFCNAACFSIFLLLSDRLGCNYLVRNRKFDKKIRHTLYFLTFPQKAVVPARIGVNDKITRVSCQLVKIPTTKPMIKVDAYWIIILNLWPIPSRILSKSLKILYTKIYVRTIMNFSRADLLWQL